MIYPMFRYRIDYAKKGDARYTSLLDLQKIWERIFRRAELPISFSQGFHPQPKFHMASPLPLGYEGNHELADLWLDVEMTVSELSLRISKNAPSGLHVNEIFLIDLKQPVLQVQVSEALYTVKPLVEIDYQELCNQIEALLHLNSLIRIRRNKEYDLRPLINSLEILNKNYPIEIEMRLSAKEGATGRPDEVIAAMNYDPLDFSYCRQKLILS
jgi:radical SAM-linked protein